MPVPIPRTYPSRQLAALAEDLEVATTLRQVGCTRSHRVIYTCHLTHPCIHTTAITAITTLRQVGVTSGDVDRLTAGAMAQTRLLPNNIREVSEADCRGIFEAAL